MLSVNHAGFAVLKYPLYPVAVVPLRLTDIDASALADIIALRSISVHGNNLRTLLRVK